MTNSNSADRDGYVAVRGARLYCRQIGDGAPLFVLHGGPDFNHAYLLPDMDRLSAAFRLIYYDQRGRGKSSAGVVPDDVTIESEIDDLEALRAHFGFERIDLLGHSWGALLAAEYATRHPQRVAHLTLLNSAPACHADWMRFRERRQALEPEALATMRAIASTRAYVDGDVASEAQYYRAHFGATLPAEHLERVVRSLRVHFARDDIVKARLIEERLYGEASLASSYDLIARLRRSTTPTLVIHGDRDFIPVECAMSIADAAKARLIVLDDCGHFAYLEKPVEVFGAIVSFAATTIPEALK